MNVIEFLDDYFIILVIAVISFGGLFWMSNDYQIKIDSYCQEKGFETGFYFEKDEGTYCWNTTSKISSTGYEYKTKRDNTFFPDETLSLLSDSKNGGKT